MFILKNPEVFSLAPSGGLQSYLRLSLWVLYSMMVLVGRFRTRLKVSRILDVVIWSFEVLFQMDRMSS